MLKARVITAALGLAIALTMLLWGFLPWRITVWLVTLVGTAEFTAIVGFKRFGLVSLWAYFVISLVEWWPHWHMLVVVQIIIGVALVLPVFLKNTVTLSQSAMVLIGALYIGYGGESMSDLRKLPHGWEWLLLLLIAIWMTDTVAFFAGKWLKGPKLWPSISPSKTVSGAVAGVIGGVVGAVVFAYLTIPGYNFWSFAVMGAIFSVAGQLGDLVESAYKRSAGVKDSGHILPGHGGILDRVDSLLFAAPLAWYLISTAGAQTWFQ